MGWIDIGAIDADLRTWQLSQPFTGNLIRIKNEVSNSETLVSNFKGLLGLTYNMDRFFDIKEIFSIPEDQLFLFQDFNINETKRLAIRNISRTTKPNQWTVRAYVWDVVINPYIPNIFVDSVELSLNSLNEINTLIDNAISDIAINTALTTQQTTDILTLITGAV